MPTSRRALLRSFAVAVGAAGVSRVFAWEPLLAAGAQVRRATPRAGMTILSSNENPYGPLPRAADAMRNALPAGNRYAFRQTFELLERLASYHKLRPDQVLVGNGSTEVLKMAVCAFTGPGKKLIYGHPTFEAAVGYAKAAGAELIAVPLTLSHAHDLDAMLAATRSGAGLVYICNPNNPTATLTPYADLQEFVRRLPAGFALLMDEAYHHFATGAPAYGSFLGHERVIVARTFSKVYGMAGIRLGYAVGSPQMLGPMRPHQLDTNINTVAAAAGAASLDDDDAMHAAAKRMIADREEFLRQAAARRLSVIPTFANFAMMDTQRPARTVISAFSDRGILIGRPFPPLETHVRISFGTPDEMRQFWLAWDEIVSTSPAKPSS